jgi:hypothetical protein
MSTTSDPIVYVHDPRVPLSGVQHALFNLLSPMIKEEKVWRQFR